MRRTLYLALTASSAMELCTDVSSFKPQRRGIIAFSMRWPRTLLKPYFDLGSAIAACASKAINTC